MFTIEQIQEAAHKAGIDEPSLAKLVATLRSAGSRARALTIICNKGIHPISEDKLPGRVIAATEGNVADQTAEALGQAVADACKKVAAVIKQEGPFSEIYLVPSGFGVLLQKLAEMIFQITGRPAATLHFDRKTNAYWPVQLDLRSIIGSVRMH